MRIVWTDTAKEELANHIRYIATQDQQAARRQRTLIHETVAALRTHPKQGRPGQVEGTRELVITGTPYLAVYGIEGDAIAIYHVHHGRQDWKQ